MKSVLVLVAELRQQQTPKMQYPGCVLFCVVAFLDAMPIDVAQCLRKSHPKETPALRLAPSLTELVLRIISKHPGPESLSDKFFVAGPCAHAVFNKDRSLTRDLSPILCVNKILDVLP